MASTALDNSLHLMLPQHVALALEVAAVVAVEELHLFLVDRLEIAAVLENLCLMERLL